jgi:hypothetical protein
MSFMVTDGVYVEVNPLGVVLLTTVRPTNKANSGGHDMQLNIANMRPLTVVACAAETNRRAAVWSSAVRLAATRAVGSALRASRLLTAMGIGLLVAALFLAGGAMWGLLPLPTMVGAIVLGLLGGVMVASARPKAHLISPFLSVDSQQQETAKRVIR